ncbi:MAG: AAA family ATPase [Prochlorotrichaceae cyanobacterium]|jgi:SpoVK/Ycf46/Vps4 family AAA+-type ATPase
MSLDQRVHELQALVDSFHPLIVMETIEEDRVRNLLQIAVRRMRIQLFEWSITQGLTRSPGGAEGPWVNEYAPRGSIKPTAFEKTQAAGDLMTFLQETNQKGVFWLKDFSRLLDEPQLIRQFRELAQDFSEQRSAIVLTGEKLELPPELQAAAIYLDLGIPEDDELLELVRDVVKQLKCDRRVQVEVNPDQYNLLVRALRGMTQRQARQVLGYVTFEDGRLTIDDVRSIIHRKTQVIRQESIVEYFAADEIQTNLGGFSGLKNWLNQVQMGFSPQAKAWNLQAPKGILIVGIQGCGKSLAAKVIAKVWKMPLLKLDAGKLYDKYVGESEKNLRQAVQVAESMSPSILWIDEIEKGLGSSDGSADGGLSRRLFGFFLTWMQEKTKEVFVIATANDISQIPPELLRKGRFDEIFFVDLPDDQERLNILKIHLMQRKQNPDRFDLDQLVSATEGFSGAEIEQAIVTALYKALYLRQMPGTELLLEQINAMIPLSVSRKESIEQLRTIARERFVSVRD